MVTRNIKTILCPALLVTNPLPHHLQAVCSILLEVKGGICSKILDGGGTVKKLKESLEEIWCLVIAGECQSLM
jgi:hypothetical protein